MSSDTERVLLYINFEPYLAQWLVNDNGGKTPVVFRKYSIENRILKTYLMSLPPNAVPNLPTDNSVPIVIPEYSGGDPHRVNYLPVGAMRKLHDAIRERFLIELWTALHQFGHIGKRRQDLVAAWMEANGIEVNDTNFNTILKIYQRQHKTYIKRIWRVNKKSKKIAKKAQNLIPH